MTQFPDLGLVSGVNSKPVTVAPNKAGKTTIPDAKPVAEIKPTVPVAISEGLASLIPSSSALPKDPQQVNPRTEEAALPRRVVPPYTQDGSGHIIRNVQGLRPMIIFTVQGDCKMVELQTAVDALNSAGIPDLKG